MNHWVLYHQDSAEGTTFGKFYLFSNSKITFGPIRTSVKMVAWECLFWNVTPFSLIVNNERFGVSSWRHLQSETAVQNLIKTSVQLVCEISYLS
jgi:hypothetical protein